MIQLGNKPPGANDVEREAEDKPGGEGKERKREETRGQNLPDIQMKGPSNAAIGTLKGWHSERKTKREDEEKEKEGEEKGQQFDRRGVIAEENRHYYEGCCIIPQCVSIQGGQGICMFAREVALIQREQTN